MSSIDKEKGMDNVGNASEVAAEWDSLRGFDDANKAQEKINQARNVSMRISEVLSLFSDPRKIDSKTIWRESSDNSGKKINEEYGLIRETDSTYGDVMPGKLEEILREAREFIYEYERGLEKTLPKKQESISSGSTNTIPESTRQYVRKNGAITTMPVYGVRYDGSGREY